jgi:SAM-dependent methyltransferase
VTSKTAERPDYGLDAPDVVRNLLIAAVIAFLPVVLSLLGVWDGVISLSVGGADISVDLVPTGLAIGLTCAAMAGWMVYTSKVGKLKEREALLDKVRWTGTERVLDVGCGRGLLLNGAARRVPNGSAVGIDLWRAEDLKDNRPEATLENARLEGVADRVRVETGDMRQLPFPNASFDVIVSRAAVHNIPDSAGRDQAITEMVRVLAPGGQLVLDDIRNLDAYETGLRSRGITDLERHGSAALAGALAILTFGSLRPGTIVARRGAAGGPAEGRTLG